MKTITKFIYPAFAALALACFALSSTARADTTALAFTGFFRVSGNDDTTSGWGFSLSNPVLLTALGVWDYQSDGLGTSHVVTVWASTGTPLVQTTVPTGTSTTLVDGFRYVPVTPTLLPAGDYIIGASIPSGNLDALAITADIITTATGVTYNGTYAGPVTGAPPPQPAYPPNGDFGPNFMFTPTQSYVAQVQQPINADGTSVFNVRRGVVPVKFTLTQDGVATCALPPATIALTRTAGGTTGQIDESVYTGSADTGSNFRIDNCQYIYNLNSSALGVGTYRVDIKINGQVVGNAAFQLK